MKSNLKSNPYQAPSGDQRETVPSAVGTQSSAGWKPLLAGFSALLVALFVMAYFMLFSVPRILMDLEARNLPTSQNLNWMIDFFGSLLRNWLWSCAFLMVLLCVPERVVPKSRRQHARQILGIILMLVSLAITIWVMATMLFAPY